MTDTAPMPRRPAVSPGEIVGLIASGEARTRTALVEATGLSRSTVAQRLDLLFGAGLVYEDSETLRSGGRPAKVLVINRSFGVIAAVDVGEDHLRVALTDLGPVVLAELTSGFDISGGPERALHQISRHIKELLGKTDRHEADLLGIGLSLPGPVDFSRGQVVGFSVLSGWDGFDIRGWFTEDMHVPVLVENDVNAIALAEYRQNWRSTDYFFYVKAGNGIGSGIVTRGLLYRGAQGAAGDIGHTQLSGHGDPLCRCGNTACVEAVAGGWALVRDLKAAGFDLSSTADVVALAQQGQPEVVWRLRVAGRALGEAIASATSLLNPGVIVVGGALGRTGEHVITGIREVVYQRALPLATRELQIVGARNDEHSGVLGAAQLVLDGALEPSSVGALLTR